MGNTSSSNSVHSNSIRSRNSRKGRADGAEPSRLSQAVSFYQTPPGSFDLGQRPISDTSTAIPDFSQLEAGGNADESDTSSLPAVQEDPKKWKPGVYSLVNVQSGTVLDLSGADDMSLIGFPAHGGKNQQWRFMPSGEGYTIRSMSSGKYLTVGDDIGHESALVAAAFPVSWKVHPVAEGTQVVIRILWHTERLAVALGDSGSGVAGTKIQLANSATDQEWQSWKLIEHETPAEEALIEPQIIRQLESVANSIPVENVIICPGQDGVTTTRTTTTTTVTTLTVVTKTPRRPTSAAVRMSLS